MAKNIYYKSMVLSKGVNQKSFKFPTTNSIGNAHVLGVWVRRRGKISETNGEINGDAVLNGNLCLKCEGDTLFDPLPLDVIATVNELSGQFFPIELNNVDWLGSEIKYDATQAAEIEFVLKYNR
jgi:hypothetical protein